MPQIWPPTSDIEFTPNETGQNQEQGGISNLGANTPQITNPHVLPVEVHTGSTSARRFGRDPVTLVSVDVNVAVATTQHEPLNVSSNTCTKVENHPAVNNAQGQEQVCGRIGHLSTSTVKEESPYMRSSSSIVDEEETSPKGVRRSSVTSASSNVFNRPSPSGTSTVYEPERNDSATTLPKSHAEPDNDTPEFAECSTSEAKVCHKCGKSCQSLKCNPIKQNTPDAESATSSLSGSKSKVSNALSSGQRNYSNAPKIQRCKREERTKVSFKKRVLNSKGIKRIAKWVSGDQDLDRAIEKAMEAQNEAEGNPLDLQGLNISPDKVPIVHPQIYEILFYQGEARPKDEKYRPSREDMDDFRKQTKTDFYQLLVDSRTHRCISLIGLPGSGKTTCSKRIISSTDLTVLLLKFKNMNYGTKALTLQELLLDKQFPELDRETCKKAFCWIKKNQSKVLIIMDGLDQAEWKLKGNPPRENYSTPQTIENLIANLCNAHLLPNVRLLITSRPHTMLMIPYKLRPNATYLLQDLSLPDMRTLFFTFAEDKAETLWNELNTSAPQLVSICLCPLILLLYIKAALSPSEKIGDIVTMTRIFATVLENLRRCENTSCYDIQEIMKQLSRLAYKATKRGTVVIKVSQLKEEGLDIDLVQDLVITLQGYRGGKNCKIFEGDERLYFCHQTFQEYFTALYISEQMSLEEFKDFSQNMFDDEWQMVRKFLCGILMDLKRFDETEVLREKQKILKTSLTKNFSGLSNKARYVIDRCMDFRECNDPSITEVAGSVFPDSVSLSCTQVSSSSAHAMSLVLQKATPCVKLLGLSNCNLDSATFSHFSVAISQMPGSIEKLDIMWNRIVGVEMVASMLPNIDSVLLMKDCFANDDGTVGRCANEEETKNLRGAYRSIPFTKLKIVLDNDLHDLSNEVVIMRDEQGSSSGENGS